MLNKIIFFSIWLGLIAYAFFLSPPDDPETIDLIINLSTSKWDGINPYIICLFNIMGVLPFIYASFLIIDGKGQKIMASPFVLGSFFLGAFSLLPYFALREENTEFTGEKTKIISILDSRFFAILITLVSITLVTIAVMKGDWQDFVQQWQTSKFIHIMSLDFCCLCLLFPTIVRDDIKKRNLPESNIFLLLSFIPLLGTLIYLCFRPQLPENNQDNFNGEYRIPNTEKVS